jgi:7,8-dihydro-6-hydroxymethylpterin-pyrophosphokinase
MVKVVLGLGSNMGARLSYLKKAVKAISLLPGFDFIALSGIYET